MKPCWSCGAQNRPCYDTRTCLCAKCVDPDGYARWKHDNPEKYQSWLDDQEDDDEYGDDYDYDEY